jgi:NarL family two-component system response regulator LiaR
MVGYARIRVVIVDDHPVVRNGLSFSLSTFDDIEIIGDAGNGEEAVRLCADLNPDVVLMDLKMPSMDGAAATRAIRMARPQTHVIALTSFQDSDLVQQAIQAGAIGYLLKDVSIGDLVEAIRSAHAGQSTLAPEALEALTWTAVRPPQPGQDLTGRQRDVLALMVQGLSNAEIAARLRVSLSTARFHVSSILRKLGAANRAEAAAIAIKYHLVD